MARNTHEVTQWLKEWDKELWGRNATYKEAVNLARRQGVVTTTPSIKKLLWNTVEKTNVDSEGKKAVKKSFVWAGVIEWWKNPDQDYGSRSPTVGSSLTMLEWDMVKNHWRKYANIWVSEGSSQSFVIRHFRRAGLPFNEKILKEIAEHIKLEVDGELFLIGDRLRRKKATHQELP